MSAISGVPGLSAATSAAGPTMNSWMIGLIDVTSKVTVSPCFTITASGTKRSRGVATIWTTRGDAAVPGTKPGDPGPGSVPLNGPRPIIEPGPMGFTTPGPTGRAEPAAAPITRMTNPATTRPRPSHSGARPVTGPGRGPSWPARTPAR